MDTWMKTIGLPQAFGTTAVFDLRCGRRLVLLRSRNGRSLSNLRFSTLKKYSADVLLPSLTVGTPSVYLIRHG